MIKIIPGRLVPRGSTVSLVDDAVAREDKLVARVWKHTVSSTEAALSFLVQARPAHKSQSIS